MALRRGDLSELPGVAVFEMGEDECGFGDVADSAGAGGDVLQDAPALGEQGEAAFGQASQAAQQRVVGAGVGVQGLPAGGVLDQGEHPDARALIPQVGQGGQVVGRCGVQRAQYAEHAEVRRAKQAQKVCEAEHDIDQIISVIETPEGS